MPLGIQVVSCRSTEFLAGGNRLLSCLVGESQSSTWGYTLHLCDSLLKIPSSIQFDTAPSAEKEPDCARKAGCLPRPPARRGDRYRASPYLPVSQAPVRYRGLWKTRVFPSPSHPLAESPRLDSVFRAIRLSPFHRVTGQTGPPSLTSSDPGGHRDRRQVAIPACLFAK